LNSELSGVIYYSSFDSTFFSVDNQTCLRYQVEYWIRLTDASICSTAADADTQFRIFDKSASEKQLLTFYLLIATKFKKIKGIVKG
jgi:hypothetical protein